METLEQNDSIVKLIKYNEKLKKLNTILRQEIREQDQHWKKRMKLFDEDDVKHHKKVDELEKNNLS